MKRRSYKIRVKVRRIDRAKEATIMIDRAAGLISVRPLRSRRVYTLPLSAVAEQIAWRVIRFELAEQKKQKKQK